MTASLTNVALRARIAVLEQHVESQSALLVTRWTQLKEAWAKEEADAAERERWDRYYADIERNNEHAREALANALNVPNDRHVPSLAVLVQRAIARMRPLEISGPTQP
jgi:hypothetical protein